jgi:hypothetical protein
VSGIENSIYRRLHILRTWWSEKSNIQNPAEIRPIIPAIMPPNCAHLLLSEPLMNADERKWQLH